MKYAIRYLPTAKEDLRAVVKYLIDEHGAGDAAENLLREIDQHIAHLAEYPYSHPLYPSPMKLPVEMRYLPVKKHIVFYTVLEPDHIVEIRRVIYERMVITPPGN